MQAGFPDAVEIVSGAEVDRTFVRLAGELQATVHANDCVMLGIMIGGLIPMARLAQMLTGDFTMDYCQVSRYRGTEQGGRLELIRSPGADLDGMTVILVDDIFDEGVTLEFVAGRCRELGARNVLSTVLVRKRHDRVATDFRPDLIGLEVDDRYVFGCGMDYRNRWRHLPEIWALRGDSG